MRGGMVDEAARGFKSGFYLVALTRRDNFGSRWRGTMGQKLKIGILGSGSGSNAQSIIDAIAAGTLDAEVVCVMTDVEDARILERAAAHNIPAQLVQSFMTCRPRFFKKYFSS